ncbi:myelin and lymphocyte protein isoform X3 [Gracilinanus agilis]|uniref:myelin and lymphocyte protein isoform X3 n=1 Tax=Gracilinanus agilis TaxID=191870 RepID=UPI001CFE2567|nr:myelin and lymphocyte protein isoform X3 [Gracilinanus agilis]
MAPAATSGGGSLPSGFSVLASFPDLLFIFEFDVSYHLIAALFYLSASVLEAYATILSKDNVRTGFNETFKHYQENISAVVFAYAATLTYVIHAVFSLIRWKSS